MNAATPANLGGDEIEGPVRARAEKLTDTAYLMFSMRQVMVMKQQLTALAD